MKSKLIAKNMQLLDIAQEVTNYLKCEVPGVENEKSIIKGGRHAVMLGGGNSCNGPV